jgi:heme oxygenase
MEPDFRSSDDDRPTAGADARRGLETLRGRLRRATRLPHEQVEAGLNLARETWTLEAYRDLLQKLLDFYAPMEEALLRLDLCACGLAMDDRLKRSWLEADLRDLGVVDPTPRGPAGAADLPELESPHAALGVMYVLEGSTLGGQVILKALRRRLDVGPDRGGRFYASYGSEIGAMWRRFLEVLERVGQAPAAADRIERAALETFTAFDRRMGAAAEPTRPPARLHG